MFQPALFTRDGKRDVGGSEGERYVWREDDDGVDLLLEWVEGVESLGDHLVVSPSVEGIPPHNIPKHLASLPLLLALELDFIFGIPNSLTCPRLFKDGRSCFLLDALCCTGNPTGAPVLLWKH